MRHARIRGGAALALIATTLPALAQERAGPADTSSFHPDSSYTAESLLRNAANQVRAGQWPEAVELYQRVIDQHGDAVAAAPREEGANDATVYVNARRFAQEALVSLPPEGRAIYRQRVDGRAEGLLLQAEARGDLAGARNFVESYFASSWGDQGLDLLGDLAFRSGRFSEALTAYQALLPDPDMPGEGLVYPDPDVDRARLFAKKLLCRAALGEAVNVDGLRKAFPDAVGPIAGRPGSLAEAVGQSIVDDHWATAPSPPGWLTFAGAADRNGRASERIEVGSFQWKVPLADASERATNGGDDFRGFGRRRRPEAEDEREPFAHPIIVGDLVIVAEEDRVVAYHLDREPEGTGDESTRELIAWESKLSTTAVPTRGDRPGRPTTRTTLTSSGDRIIARLGAPGGGGTLVAIRSNRDIEGKLLWRRPASEIPLPTRRAGADRAVAVYEGTPVADSGRVYVALTESDAQTWSYVASLDAETGRVLWVRFLGNGAATFDPMSGAMMGQSPGARLLTLAGSRVYYQTNMGALACLDAETGGLRWLATYSTRDRDPGAVTQIRRGLNPAVVAEGLVIAAPEDSPSFYAFDAATGRLAWKSQPVPQAAHLLGATGGKLFATGDRLYTFELRTGKVLRVWPEAGMGFQTAGRGLLAGDRIYWPTPTEILVLDQATGSAAGPPIPLFQAFGHGGGNLAAADGYLVVARRDELVSFCQNRRLIERYKLRVARSQGRATDYFELARLARADDQIDQALSYYREAIARAGGGDEVDGRSLADEARSHVLQLLLDRAEKSVARADWAAAEKDLRETVMLSQAPGERLTALCRLVEVEEGAGRPDRAVSVLQEVLTDPSMSRSVVSVDDSRGLRSDLWIAERLEQLIKRHGRGIYEPYDTEAAALLERGRRDRDPGALESVSRIYPASSSIPAALLALGDLRLEQGRPSRAADAYQRLLGATTDEAYRALAQLGLSAAAEALDDPDEARFLANRAADLYRTTSLKALGIDRSVAELAGERLARLASEATAADASDLRLEPAWEHPLASGERPITIEGQLGIAFLRAATRLHALDAETGAPLWSRDLEVEPTWIGGHDTRIVVGSSDELVGLDARDGAIAWRLRARDAARAVPSVDPFTPGVTSQVPGEARSGKVATLHGFRLVGTRIVALRGDREIFSVDVEDGRRAWVFEPSATGRDAIAPEAINPNLRVTPESVIFQLGDRRTIVLDLWGGAVQAQVPIASQGLALGSPPTPLDGGLLALAVDSRAVALVDPGKGVTLWTDRDESALPPLDPPRIVEAGGTLLVIYGGRSLVRLDPTGRRVWARCLGGEGVDPSRALAADDERLYAVAEGRLLALRLSDGEPAWSRPLTGRSGEWALCLHGSTLIVSPVEEDGRGSARESRPIQIFRRDDGGPVQSINLDAPGAGPMHLDGTLGLVATPSRLVALRLTGGGSALDVTRPGTTMMAPSAVRLDTSSPAPGRRAEDREDRP